MYLQHLCNLKLSDVLVETEGILLNEEDIAGRQHLVEPFQLYGNIKLPVPLDNHEPGLKVVGKLRDIVLVFLLKQLPT